MTFRFMLTVLWRQLQSFIFPIIISMVDLTTMHIHCHKNYEKGEDWLECPICKLWYCDEHCFSMKYLEKVSVRRTPLLFPSIWIQYCLGVTIELYFLHVRHVRPLDELIFHFPLLNELQEFYLIQSYTKVGGQRFYFEFLNGFYFKLNSVDRLIRFKVPET